MLDGTQWEGEEDNRRVLVDGGVFANNPAMIALSEALSFRSGMDEILLCAIGTGMNDRARDPIRRGKGLGTARLGQAGDFRDDGRNVGFGRLPCPAVAACFRR